MSLRVVGAGVGRTGTTSLKFALSRLLGGPCYHMLDVFERGDFPAWTAASRGNPPDWHRLFEGYAACVDWPASAFWPEIAEAFPDSVILLSTREPRAWFKSARETIFAGNPGDPPPGGPPMREMLDAMLAARFTPRVREEDAAIAAFDAWNADVLARAPKERLVTWSADQGWEPLCAALKLPVPSEPFPKANTTEEFNARRAVGGPPVRTT